MIDKVIEEINRADTILVVGHIMPDGDDVSSICSLVMGLEKYGKKVTGAIDDEIPGYLEELPIIKEKIRTFDCVKNTPADLIIIVDASSPDRVGRMQELFEYKRVVVIDHHATNLNFGHVNWVDATSASTAQLVFKLNQKLGVKYDEELATINLLGVATDTGFFKYSNTNAQVFEDVSNLVSFGGNISYITNAILENKPIENVLLFKDVLENLKFKKDKKIAYTYVSLEMLKKHNILPKNTPPFVGDLRALKGVEVAIVFNEHEKNVYHTSMRSKKYFDVSEVALHFGGGGHVRAAGFSKESENIEKLMEEVTDYIAEKMEN